MAAPLWVPYDASTATEAFWQHAGCSPVQHLGPTAVGRMHPAGVPGRPPLALSLVRVPCGAPVLSSMSLQAEACPVISLKKTYAVCAELPDHAGEHCAHTVHPRHGDGRHARRPSCR